MKEDITYKWNLPIMQEDISTLFSSDTRIMFCLKRERINTIRDIMGLGEDNISRIPNIGAKSILKIKEGLKSVGLELRPASQPARQERAICCALQSFKGLLLAEKRVAQAKKDYKKACELVDKSYKKAFRKRLNKIKEKAY